MKNICKELNCGRDCYGNGLCSMHWQRFRRHGDLVARERGMKGKQHSAETKLKMRASAILRGISDETKAKWNAKRRGRIISPEQRIKLSLAFKGVPKTPEHVAKVAAAQRGKKRGPHSAETRAKMSLAQLGKPKSAEHVRRVLAGRWHGKRPEYGGIKFRSSYEVILAKAFDARNIKWLYEQKRFNLGTCSYLPDFYLPELGAYWEAKGYFSPESQKKVGLFRELHPDKPLIVATKAVIKMMEV